MKDDLNMQQIAMRLQQARGLESRASVCKAVGVSYSALQMYENGQRLPRPAVMKKLASHYRTTVQALFFDE